MQWTILSEFCVTPILLEVKQAAADEICIVLQRTVIAVYALITLPASFKFKGLTAALAQLDSCSKQAWMVHSTACSVGRTEPGATQWPTTVPVWVTSMTVSYDFKMTVLFARPDG
ncbi:hypothetical protein RRG08_023118 [Elysia crispata]|uniref:Uncharacterized protein n=1 Tax=Elysia crispata TaxID=231223 RepID=A0AAE0XMI7_9GAST|nr:hypothetical protein RRG08_023118 [Elysia crispata]